jgi:hypothetical protein
MPAIVKHLEDIPGFRNAYEKAYHQAMKEAVSFAVGTTPFVVTISAELARIIERTHNVELLVIEDGWQPIQDHTGYIFNKNFQRIPQYNDNFSFNAVEFKTEEDLTMFILKWS